MPFSARPPHHDGVGPKEGQRPRAATVHDLHGIVRGLVLLTGLSALAGGGIAVFTSDNQAGTVGLLVVGAVAMLLAIVGRVPLRWVIGGNEFDMTQEAAEATAEAVASQLTPASTAKVAADLMWSDAARSTARAMMDVVAVEQSASELVASTIGVRQGWTYSEATGPDTSIDGVIEDSNGRHIGVVFRLGRQGSSLKSWLYQSKGRAFDLPIVLVVPAMSALSDESRMLIDARVRRGEVEVVSLRAPDFDRRFLEACDRAFTRPRLPR